MRQRMMTNIAIVAALLAASPTAWAQRSAASKISGSAYEYPYFYNSAGMYQDTAYRHADVLRENAGYGEPVPREIAQEHTAAIRASLEAANRKYASLRKLAGNHKAVNMHLDAIHAHHKTALAYLDRIDQHVADGKGDPNEVGEAAHAAAAALKNAQAEHETLRGYFGKPVAK